MRVRMYLDKALPAPGWWSSVGHERKQSPRAGQRQKAKGVRPGLPDVMIWYDGQFIAIELKTVTGRLSDTQIAFADAMRRNRFSHCVARSVAEVHSILVARCVPVERSMHVLALVYDAELAKVQPAPRGASKSRAVAVKPSQRALKGLARARKAGVFA